MNVWAIVPVKPFVEAKSRLSGVLSPEERAVLAERFFRRTLSTLSGIAELEGVLVVSRDATALAIAAENGAIPLWETGLPELNAALTEAAQTAIELDADGVLILPADLPLLTAEDVAHVLSLAQKSGTIVIAPDGAGEGTNGLLVAPPNLFPFAFGVGSFARHIRSAEAVGATLHVYRSPNLALDVDVPADLERLHQLEIIR